MRRLLILLLGLYSPAYGVEVTDMPDGLRGDVTLTYAGQFGRHSFVQEEEEVGRRRINQHDLTVRMEMAPVDGVSLYLAIPTTITRVIKFPEAYEMMTDPVTGKGVYIADSPTTPPPDYEGSGGHGVWFGVGFAPYAERYKKPHQLTWRLDFAARTKPKRNFWELSDGKYGTVLGGNAFRLSGAFSANNGSSRPYMKLTWTHETRRSIKLGEQDLEVKPGTTVLLQSGLEVVLAPQDGKKLEPYFEVSAGFGYRSWRTVPSGIFLPSVLATAEEHTVTQTGALLGQAGIHFGFRFLPYIQWRVGMQAGYETPHLVEDIYPVKTSSKSMDLIFVTALSVGYR